MDYSGSCKSAFKAIYKNLTSPTSVPLKVLRVTIGAPLYMAMTPVVITFLMLAALFHLTAYPFTRPPGTFLDYGKATLNELFSLLIVMYTYPINLEKENPESKANQTPILMVHGFLHNSSAWVYHKSILEGKTGPIYTLNLGSPFHSISHHEEKIQEKVEQIRKETGKNDLILVAHSMGGLASFNYCKENPKHIKGFVTLGTPFEGTGMANLAIGQSAREMTPNSLFIQKITGNLKALATPALHISSQCDIIVPFKSALPKTPKGEHMGYTNAGHMSLLYSKTVTNEIFEFYEKHK